MTAKWKKPPPNMRKDTILSHAGRSPERFDGAVNVPVIRASTILYPDVESHEDRTDRFSGVRYGRYGTTTRFVTATSCRWPSTCSAPPVSKPRSSMATCARSARCTPKPRCRPCTSRMVSSSTPSG